MSRASCAHPPRLLQRLAASKFARTQAPLWDKSPAFHPPPKFDSFVENMSFPKPRQQGRDVEQIYHGNSSIALRVSSHVICRSLTPTSSLPSCTNLARARPGFSTLV